MSEPNVIRLANPDRELVKTGDITGVLRPVRSTESLIETGARAHSFEVPLNQQPLIQFVTLTETSLIESKDNNAPLIELDGETFSEPLSVDEARGLINELQTACKYIEDTFGDSTPPTDDTDE